MGDRGVRLRYTAVHWYIVPDYTGHCGLRFWYTGTVPGTWGVRYWYWVLFLIQLKTKMDYLIFWE